MTPEEWTKVEDRLRGAYGSVELLVDGFEIYLAREVSKNMIHTTIYVNGSIKGVDIGVDETEINRRFYRPNARYALKMRRGKNREKELRKFKRLGWKDFVAMYQRRVTIHWPWWNNFNSMKKHLIKNNESIELVKKPEVEHA